MALIFQQGSMICIGRLMLEGINSCPPTYGGQNYNFAYKLSC